MRNRFKKILLFALSAAVLTVTAFAVNSGAGNDTTASDSGTQNQEGFSSSAENDNLTLSYNPDTLAIKVLNKQSGHIWQPPDVAGAENLNTTWKNFAASGLVLGYFDKNGKPNETALAGAKTDIKTKSSQDGFSSDITFTELGISLTLEVTLNKDSVDIRVPYNSIKEKDTEKYSLSYISLAPFFGASQGMVNDEFFLPDGSGAIIDLSRKPVAQNAFSARFYGDDIGMLGETALKKYSASGTPKNLSMPVYGIAKNKTDAVLCYLNSGSEYAALNAYVNGIVTDYNFIYSSFYYRDSYFQPVNRQGNGYTAVQESMNEFDAGLRLMFVSGENVGYSELAVRYRNELINEKVLTPNAEAAAPTLRLEVLMADNKTGTLGKKVIPVSDANFVNKVLNELSDAGASALSVTLEGYQSDGASNASPVFDGFSGGTGTDDDYRTLIKNAEKLGVPLYFETDVVKVYTDAGGFKKTDIAQTAAKQLVSLGGETYNKFRILAPDISAKFLDRHLDKLNGYGVSGISFRSIGNLLYSSWWGHPSTRVDTVGAYQKMLQNAGTAVELNTADAYLWDCADSIANIHTTGSDYIITSESVPFMQMVLKGSVKMFAKAQNLNSRGTLDALYLVDYGINPTFFITKEEPTALTGTESDYVFTSEYALWKDDMIAAYKNVSKALVPVQNATFDRRVRLADGIFETAYSNGVHYIINYSNNEYVSPQGTVAAQSYLQYQE